MSTLTRWQFSDVLASFNDFSAQARVMHATGNYGRAKDYACIARLSRRRIRAHVRERRKRLCEMLSRSRDNVIAVALANKLLKAEIA